MRLLYKFVGFTLMRRTAGPHSNGETIPGTPTKTKPQFRMPKNREGGFIENWGEGCVSEPDTDFSVEYKLGGASNNRRSRVEKAESKQRATNSIKEFMTQSANEGYVENLEAKAEELINSGVYTQRQMDNLLVVGYTNKIQTLTAMVEIIGEQSSFFEELPGVSDNTGSDEVSEKMLTLARQLNIKRNEALVRLYGDVDWDEATVKQVIENLQAQDFEDE